MRIKTYSLIGTIAILFAGMSSFAQDAAPEIKKSTVLTYQVTENGDTYNYTVTITKFSETDGISADWKDNKKSPGKGSFQLPYDNTSAATELLVKPATGKETIGEDKSRIFISDAMSKDIAL